MKLLRCLILVLIGSYINSADLIIWSYNRPLQLESCLRSIEENITGLDNVTVIFRSDKDYISAYYKVQSQFQCINFLEQKKPPVDFKPLTMNAVNSSGKYIIFCVDDLIVRDKIDLHYAEQLLESTGAYGYYFRLGQNINYCFALNLQTPPPSLKIIDQQTYSFKINEGRGDWGYPNSVDMTLVRTASVKQLFSQLNFNSPNSLEGGWAGKANINQVGLCPKMSAIINIPMNIVSEYQNRQLRSFSAEQLLEMFQNGYRIDLEDVYRFLPRSCHVDYTPKFVKEKECRN